MENTPLDIITWPTQEAAHQDELSAKKFEFYFQNQYIGRCSVRLLKNAWALCDEKQFFPESWFYDNSQFLQFFGTQALLKPILEVTKFNFSDFQGQGFGRMGLQTLFRLSYRLGAEGRITLDAQKEKTSLRDPATFYEHCGFKGNEGVDGRKYFEPTRESIQALFSKPAHPLFQMKEVPFQESEYSIINRKTGRIKIPQALKRMLERQKS